MLSSLPGVLATPTPTLSPRMLELALYLGVGLISTPFVSQLPHSLHLPLPPRLAHAARTLLPGHFLYIYGPSASGKTTLLKSLAAHLPHHSRELHWCPPPTHHPPKATAVIDLLRGPLSFALANANNAGLCDASTLLRPPNLLSEGERWRLALAFAMQHIRPHVTTPTPQTSPAPRLPPALLLVDGWCEPLDDLTARCVSLAAHRWATRANVALIVASTKPPTPIMPTNAYVSFHQPHARTS